MIVGDALLHTPALGELAAFYHSDLLADNGGNDPMSQNTVEVPTGIWDRIMDAFTSNQTPPAPQEPKPAPVADNFAAEVETLTAQVSQLAATIEKRNAEIDRLQSEQEAAARVANFSAQLQETAVAGDAELAALLANLDDATAAALMQRFSALSAQIGAGLTDDQGHSGDGHGKPDQFTSIQTAVTQYQADNPGASYNYAITALTNSNPELFEEDN